MNFVSVIHKKARKNKLNKQEIDYSIKSIVEGKISDYLITAWLMAFHINNCSLDEAYFLTLAMWRYSEKIDLIKFKFQYPIIDKHSTGGVDDKVTLILAPIVASLGVSIAKLSGKSLGLLGGQLINYNQLVVKQNYRKSKWFHYWRKSIFLLLIKWMILFQPTKFYIICVI